MSTTLLKRLKTRGQKKVDKPSRPKFKEDIMNIKSILANPQKKANTLEFETEGTDNQ